MNTPIIRKISLGVTFQPIASQRTVGTFTIRAPSSATMVTLLSDDGVTEVQLDKQQQFTLEGVDLAAIQAKGGLGDSIFVIGATRTV